MISPPRSARAPLYQRILAGILLVPLTSALSSTTSAEEAPPPQEQVAQPQPQAAPNYAPPPGAPYAPAPGTPYYAGTEQYRPRPRISKGLLIGGAATLGASYLLSAAIGLATMSLSEYECIDCKDVGPWLLLPLFGPFIGAGEAVEGGGLFAMFGVVQVVGLGLLIGGIIRFKSSKRRAQEQGYVLQLPHNKTLALDVATSPRFSGPELSLRF